MKQALIQQLTVEKATTVQQGCKLLGVSRSGVYAAKQRKRQPQKICGTRIRLRSLMKELELKLIWKPKFVHTTDSNHNLPVYEPAELVCSALQIAIAQRRPPTAAGLDRALRPRQPVCQSRIPEFTGAPWFSRRKGNCWDNAVWRRQYANHAEAINFGGFRLVNAYFVPTYMVET